MKQRAHEIEPALIGRVIDSATKKPLQGVSVFGYYYPQFAVKGNDGEVRTFSQPCSLHSFAAATDADGIFRLAAWVGDPSTNDARKRGSIVVLYKAGYETTGQHPGHTVRRWAPVHEGAPVVTKDAIDWSKLPVEMQPVNPNGAVGNSVEAHRWGSINRSLMGYVPRGVCGWETYALYLVAAHNETKALIRAAVRQEDLDQAGYQKQSSKKPLDEIDYAERTFVDMLFAEHAKAPENWKCANPRQVLLGVKL